MAANFNQGNAQAGGAIALAMLDSLVAKGVLTVSDAKTIFRNAANALQVLPIDQASPALQIIAQLGLRYEAPGSSNE
jgi:hypothetical protein